MDSLNDNNGAYIVVTRREGRWIDARFVFSNTIAQDLDSEAAKQISKKERERLKVQDRLRREQLERVREEQNARAAAGDVRGWSGCC